MGAKKHIEIDWDFLRKYNENQEERKKESSMTKTQQSSNKFYKSVPDHIYLQNKKCKLFDSLIIENHIFTSIAIIRGCTTKVLNIVNNNF